MQNPLFEALFLPHLGSDAPFLTDVGGDTISYGAFTDRVGATVNAFAALGLEPGDRVAVQVEKSVEALEIYAACLASGVVFMPLNTAWSSEDVSFFLSDAAPALLICDPAKEVRLAPVARAVGAAIRSLSRWGSGSFADLVGQQDAGFLPGDCDEDATAVLLYTVGTTGRPKGVMLSQANLLANARAQRAAWHISSADCILHVLPLFSADGLFPAVNTVMLAGGQLIYLSAFDQHPVLNWLPKASVFVGLPSYFQRLLDDKGFTAKTAARMRLFICGSAPLPPELHARFLDRSGHSILERYGMTEAGTIAANPLRGERRAGSVGMPLKGVELRLVDGEGQEERRPGRVGAIEVRGETVFKGYWRRPETTRDKRGADGFFVTGDLGRRDKDGYLYIVGRAKDLVVSNGYTVCPKEIEHLLEAEENISEAAVIGVPNPAGGESVVAVLVAKPGSDVDREALRARLSAKLTKYKQPKDYILLRELPRNAMGKVQKNLLRERYRNIFRQPQAAAS